MGKFRCTAQDILGNCLCYVLGAINPQSSRTAPKQRVCNGLQVATGLEWEMGGSELHSFLGACLRLEQELDLPGGGEEGISWSEGIRVRTLRLLVVL